MTRQPDLSGSPLVVLELFAGSGTFTRTARELGHTALGIDLESAGADMHADLLTLDPRDLPEPFSGPDVVWASPPCQGFSVAGLRWSWPDGRPGDKAMAGADTLSAALRLIAIMRPHVWFIENPRGMMRTLGVMDALPRHTITLCQYGMPYQKPTDIWTNSRLWHPRPACSPADPCHASAPRGTHNPNTIQGLRNAAERAVMPEALAAEVLHAAEREVAWAKPRRHREREPLMPGPLFREPAAP